MKTPAAKRQVLHLVFGGELQALDDVTFKDVGRLDIVGVYADLAAAEKAWRTKARDTIDNAQMRYFIVPLHKLLDPAKEKKQS
jgi:hypothetical protein